MNGFNRLIDEAQYCRPARTFIIHITCYRALLLQGQSRYTNSAHSEIMFLVCCLIKN
jgi:hypothetical protein